MDTFLPAFAIFAIVMVGMAVGVIVGNRRIKGSCGGLGALRDEIGRPLCECGAAEGQTCGRDDGLEYAAAEVTAAATPPTPAP